MQSIADRRREQLKDSPCIHEPHLVMRHVSIAPGEERPLGRPGWSVLQVSEGTGYCLRPDGNHLLEPGTALLVAADATGVLRASHLNVLDLSAFSVVPKRLAGLLSLNEHAVFASAASRSRLSVQIFPPVHAVATAMKEICSLQPQTGVSFRLKLVQLFVYAFGRDLDQPAPPGTASDARKRLNEFLKDTPSSELLEITFDEIARRAHCTSRHLSRIFRELVGVSFSEKRAELRLDRALDLLATSDAKIVDVALESGYRSLSLFNLMFSRRFGTSPNKWRRQHGSRQNQQTRTGR